MAQGHREGTLVGRARHRQVRVGARHGRGRQSACRVSRDECRVWSQSVVSVVSVVTQAGLATSRTCLTRVGHRARQGKGRGQAEADRQSRNLWVPGPTGGQDDMADRQEAVMAWTQKRRTPSDYIDTHKAARVLAAHGHVCHLCGHEGGVLNVDHDLALGTPTCKTPPIKAPPIKSLTTMPSRTIASHDPSQSPVGNPTPEIARDGGGGGPPRSKATVRLG